MATVISSLAAFSAATSATAAGAAGVTAAGVGAVEAGTLAAIASGEAVTIGAVEATAFAASQGAIVNTAAFLGSNFALLESVSLGVGALSAFRGGQAQAASLEAAAAAETQAAKQERIKGLEQANALRENLISTLSANLVGAAAAGIEPSGSAAVLTRENIRVSRFDLSRIRTSARANELARRSAGRRLLAESEAVRFGGGISAAEIVLGGAFRRVRRGTVPVVK